MRLWRCRYGRGCRFARRDALHRGLRPRRFRLDARQRLGFFVRGHLHHVVAGGQRLGLIQVVVAQARNLVMGRFQVRIRDQYHIDLEAGLDAVDIGALLIQQVGGHIHRNLGMHGGGVFLHRFFLDDAQDMQRGGFDAADMADAVAARAGDGASLAQRRAQALARQFHQAEARDLAHLHPRTVEVQRFTQAVFHLPLVALRFHVDEVDDDQPAQIAQAQLARNLLGCLEIGAKRRLLDVAAARGARRVDVDRHQRLGVVDDHGPARGQVHLARVGGLDLVLDLETRKQRHVVAVTLHPAYVVGHHVRHELLRLLEDRIGIDQDLADLRMEVVADGANDEAAFLVDQKGAFLGRRRFLDRVPQLQQVFQIPVEFIERAADAGGARDHAHPRRNRELIHGVAQLFALFTFDPARHAAAARVVGHEYQVAPGQADESGKRGAFVAALVLLHLDDQFLAFLERVLDTGAADVDPCLEIGACDFLEGEKTVAIGAVVDERSFQAGLDAGDDAFVDIALALLFRGRFNVEVNQFLAIDYGDTEFFGLCRIKQHALHECCSRARMGRTNLGQDKPGPRCSGA